MTNECPNCGKVIKSNIKYCGKPCHDVIRLKAKAKEIAALKTEILSLKRRITEQDNLWENLVGDLADDNIVSPAYIRWWSQKLATKHNISNENKMLGWLSDVASIIETYGQAKNIQ